VVATVAASGSRIGRDSCPVPLLTFSHLLEVIVIRRRKIAGTDHDRHGTCILIAFVKWIAYSFLLCLVIVIISICFVVLIENLLLAGISIPLLLDFQTRINNNLIQNI
jgi:hypothetical protein